MLCQKSVSIISTPHYIFISFRKIIGWFITAHAKPETGLKSKTAKCVQSLYSHIITLGMGFYTRLTSFWRKRCLDTPLMCLMYKLHIRTVSEGGMFYKPAFPQENLALFMVIFLASTSPLQSKAMVIIVTQRTVTTISAVWELSRNYFEKNTGF